MTGIIIEILPAQTNYVSKLLLPYLISVSWRVLLRAPVMDDTGAIGSLKPNPLKSKYHKRQRQVRWNEQNRLSTIINALCTVLRLFCRPQVWKATLNDWKLMELAMLWPHIVLKLIKQAEMSSYATFGPLSRRLHWFVHSSIPSTNLIVQNPETPWSRI